jgi:hypothetical protein
VFFNDCGRPHGLSWAVEEDDDSMLVRGNMNDTFRFTLRVALWALLVIVCIDTMPTMADWHDETLLSMDIPEPHARCAWENCENSPGSGPTYPSPPDYEAERRAQEAAAERQRQKEEADRIERQHRQEEADRIAAEKKRKEEEQAKFIRDRDEAIKKIKGSSGTSVTPTNGGLKGSSPVNTGLKELRGADRVTRDTQGTQTAWKQLHCAAEVAGFALAALGQRGDYGEFGALSVEAMKSLDGQRVDVVCTAAPPFPDSHGRAEDMEQAKQTQRTILSRAAAIAERMKQRGDQPAGSQAAVPAAMETPEDKLRRVQRELNKANDEKITGKSQQEIDQQERDRKELTKLILVNNRLEKGELTNLSVGLGDDVPLRPSKPSAKPVPAP